MVSRSKGDNGAAAVGTDVVEDGRAFTTIGTSGVVFAHTDKLAIDPKGRVHTFCCAVPGAWHVMGVTQAAGLSLKWFRDNFCMAEKEAAALMGEDPYNLQVAYDFNTEEWSILGARPGIGESGMSDKELRLLQPGDVVTTVWYYSTISGDDGTEAYTAEEFTVTAQTSFYEIPLPNGRYGMVFEMRDAMGHYAYTEPVFFLCDGGEISTLLYN